MRFLIDTNVVSELAKDTTEKQVLDWFIQQGQDELFVSALTVGEINYGIERLTDGKLKRNLEKWFENELLSWFGGRILPVDKVTMLIWAYIRTHGRILPTMDSLIAATALANEAKLVTRNADDFADIEGLETVNPWHGRPSIARPIKDTNANLSLQGRE